MYICLFGRSKKKRKKKKVEHRKEDKYASMGGEYSHNSINLCVANLWSINVTLMDGLEDVYVVEINHYG